VLPCETLPYNRDGVSYVVLQRATSSDNDDENSEALAPVGTFTAMLRFVVKDVDSSGEADGEGYEDEYVYYFCVCCVLF
jgi:hypothetical protein